MNFERINTPSSRIITLRDGSSDTFRPSATGHDSDVLRTKVRMEQLEGALLDQASNVFSSAAHADRDKAVENAQFEAVERMSLAAWWALERPVITRANDDLIDELTSTYLDGNFELAVGYVESVSGTGYASVAILENKHEYPYAVLGGGYHNRATDAAEKAFLESIQSWSATQWLRENQPHNMPHWDMAELQKRGRIINEAPLSSEVDAALDLVKHMVFFQDKDTYVEPYNDHYVAWVLMDAGYSYEIADQVRRPDEMVSVFTQHNY